MILRGASFLLFVAMALLPVRGDDVLFFGNSFTFGAGAPVVKRNGGVPKLFEEIARARGRQVTASAVTRSGEDWEYHLAQPETAAALKAKTWTWVVLQDLSTRPTHAGDIVQFMHDGETFSDRIAAHSPRAGIVLFETWARPAGTFYSVKPGHDFAGPTQMMAELHQSYGKLRNDLAARNPGRPTLAALVGTAFARATAEYPAINLNATDRHHASAEGYYLAALVIYETIYHDSVVGAPTQFYRGALIYPADEAAKLQKVADEVAGGAQK